MGQQRADGMQIALRQRMVEGGAAQADGKVRGI
jgi:hypothetical protein